MNNYFLNITAINIHIDSYLAVCITIMTFTMQCFVYCAKYLPIQIKLDIRS